MVSCGCAGPTSPFGAISLFSSKLEKLEKPSAPSVQVRFLPERQVLHEARDFAVEIVDLQGISSDHNFQIFFNRVEITSSFLLQADRVWNEDRTRMMMTFPNLRLLPRQRNSIHVLYRRSATDDQPVYAEYLAPNCRMYDSRRIASVRPFSPPQTLIETIEHHATSNSVNPSFLTALIAQESAFNPAAVSWAKAIGLTQVTPLAEEDIIKSHQGWPRHPGINDMSYLSLKGRILAGEITEHTEWRLNPEMSIVGGISYIKYLLKYWSLPDNAELLQTNYPDASTIPADVVLASYNSGPSRVKRALKAHGRDFLYESSDLTEARRYVNRIKSYCYHFADENFVDQGGDHVPSS